MPKFDAASLVKSPSLETFQRATQAHGAHRQQPEVAEQAVARQVDSFVCGQQTEAMAQAQRLMKRCMVTPADPMAASSVWFATVRRLETQVPNYQLARTLVEGLNEASDTLIDDIEEFRPEVERILSPAEADSLILRPIKALVQSVDLQSLMALAVAQRLSPRRDASYSRLGKRPFLAAHHADPR